MVFFNGGMNYSVFPPQPIHVGCIDHPVDNYFTSKCWPAELGKHARIRTECVQREIAAQKFLSDIVYLNCLLGHTQHAEGQNSRKLCRVRVGVWRCLCAGGAIERYSSSCPHTLARQESDWFLYALEIKLGVLFVTHTHTRKHRRTHPPVRARHMSSKLLMCLIWQYHSNIEGIQHNWHCRHQSEMRFYHIICIF